MAKREKIILIIMALVAFYGVYEFMFSSGGRKKPAAPAVSVAGTKKFIADVAASLKDDFMEKNMYIIRQARAVWPQDPFWRMEPRQEAGKQAVEESRKEEKSQGNRVYTGYLEMGEKKLAIIDGVEYGIGEELGRGGPVVKSIGPKEVVIAVPETAGEVVLPLQEQGRTLNQENSQKSSEFRDRIEGSPESLRQAAPFETGDREAIR
jgi:hypothetical protein